MIERFIAIGVSATLIVGAPLREKILRVPKGLVIIVADVTWNENASDDANAQLQSDSLSSILAIARPDAVVIALPWPNYGYGLQKAIAKADIPCLTVVHLAPRVFYERQSAVTEEGNSQIPARLQWWAAVSKPIARRIEILHRLPRGSVAVIHNGVALPVQSREWRSHQRLNVRRDLGIPLRQQLVLIIGRLDHSKGIDLVPDIVNKLRCDNIAVVCAGEGPLAAVLTQPIQQVVGRTSFKLLGEIENVPEWMIAADVLLMPSRLEGCPLVFLEAASMGCPVVGTEAALEFLGKKASEIAHVVQTDDVIEMSNGIRMMLDTPEVSKSKVTSASGYVSIFTEERMIGSYIRMLRKMVAIRSRRRC